MTHSWDISSDRDIVAWRPSREQPPGSGLHCMYLLLLCIWCVTWATCSVLLLIFHTATFGTFNLAVITWQMGEERHTSLRINKKSIQLEKTRQLGSRMCTARKQCLSWLFCQRHILILRHPQMCSQLAKDARHNPSAYILGFHSRPRIWSDGTNHFWHPH